MTRVRKTALATSAAAVVLLGVLAVRSVTPESDLATVTSSAPLVALPIVHSESDIRDLDIAFFAQRVSLDATGANDRNALAALLITRSRYTGETADLDEVERLTRQSIALRPERNGQAFELLATALLARHAFMDARSVMQQADSLSPETPSHLALLGEIELEMGLYDAARQHLSSIRYDGEQLTIGSRLARWYELTGHADIARQFVHRTIVRADRRDDLPREQVAWFHYRLGELELRTGRYAAADSAFHAALAVHPGDIRALGGLTRLAVQRADWTGAIEFGAEATAVQLDPATIGAMSVAYAALGDTAQAASFAQAMAVSALRQPGRIHRTWGLFLLDHGTVKDRADVLAHAREDLQERQDVYGHDLMAWALYRNGELDKARSHMQMALAQHTEDVLLTAHAKALGIAIQPLASSPVRPPSAPRVSSIAK